MKFENLENRVNEMVSNGYKPTFDESARFEGELKIKLDEYVGEYKEGLSNLLDQLKSMHSEMKETIEEYNNVRSKFAEEVRGSVAHTANPDCVERVGHAIDMIEWGLK